jgi:hypothetical protein
MSVLIWIGVTIVIALSYAIYLTRPRRVDMPKPDKGYGTDEV